MRKNYSESDLRGFLTDYPREMVEGDPGEVLDRYFAPGFSYVNDGITLDRDRLVAHVRPARKNVITVDVQVHDTVVADGHVAARYTMRASMRKHDFAAEIYLFGDVDATGRFTRITQTTRTLD